SLAASREVRSGRPGERHVVELATGRGHRGGRRNLGSAVADPPEIGPVDAETVPGVFAGRRRIRTPARTDAVLLRRASGDRTATDPRARSSAALQIGRR